jgi:2,5-diketo-D-gluconate reductase B
MADTDSPDAAPTHNGMPALGLGTWENADPEQCAESVRTALEAGYRHVDTAQAYGNEESVGEGIARADVPREDVFLATKVWREHFDREGVVDSTEESLAKLGVDAVDLLYVHWPPEDFEADLPDVLAGFDDLHDRGLIERVAISNFQPDQVERAVELLDAPVFANQVEMHPFLPQEDVRAACATHGVEVVAYSPLARGEVMDDPTLGAVAEKHDASPAQVSLAWLREKGVTAIPKATSEAHIRDNWASLGLALDDEDVATIDDIDRREREVDPSWAPW